MITVQGRFFALYRERVGQNTAELQLPDNATAGDGVAEVLRRWPNFAPDPTKVVVAVNREYVGHRHPLKKGDELAFIPPVSGGA